MLRGQIKSAVRRGFAAPGIRHGLRWFINEPRVPARWRDLAHRKLAKRARFSPTETFVYTSDNGRALRFAHVGTANYLYWRNSYEPETTTVYVRLAEQASVILDIGAADGLYSVFAAAANPSARILTFEPGAAAAEVCRHNLALNEPLTQNVDLHEMALADFDGEATLYVAGESGGTSSMNEAFRRNRTEETIRVRKGDSILEEESIARVDLVKIDTESTEPAVLRGLDRCLRRDHPDVICEVLAGRTEEALDTVVTALAYRRYAIGPDGLRANAKLVADPAFRTPNYLFSSKTPEELRALGLRVLS